MTTPLQLDCGNFDSALRTTSAILGFSGSDLLHRLRSFDFDALSTEMRRNDYDKLMLDHCLGMTEDDLPTPDVVYWFHATRVPPGTTFADGILPLSAVKDRIMRFTGELAAEWVSAAEWNDFRNEIPDGADRPFGVIPDEGPYAMLCKDALFIPDEIMNHDYLGLPEIVEDICAIFQKRFGKPLVEKFTQSTRPCIVKFRSAQPRPDALARSINYIHRLAVRKELSLCCNTCFDADGVAVPASDILSVEWPTLKIDSSRFTRTAD